MVNTVQHSPTQPKQPTQPAGTEPPPKNLGEGLWDGLEGEGLWEGLEGEGPREGLQNET